MYGNNQVPEVKMTVHVGFVKLRMAVTTYNNISSQVTVHYRRFPNMRMAVTTDNNIFSYLTEAEMTMHVTSIQKGRSTIFRGNPDTEI